MIVAIIRGSGKLIVVDASFIEVMASLTSVTDSGSLSPRDATNTMSLGTAVTRACINKSGPSGKRWGDMRWWGGAVVLILLLWITGRLGSAVWWYAGYALPGFALWWMWTWAKKSSTWVRVGGCVVAGLVAWWMVVVAIDIFKMVGCFCGVVLGARILWEVLVLGRALVARKSCAIPWKVLLLLLVVGVVGWITYKDVTLKSQCRDNEVITQGERRAANQALAERWTQHGCRQSVHDRFVPSWPTVMCVLASGGPEEELLSLALLQMPGRPWPCHYEDHKEAVAHLDQVYSFNGNTTWTDEHHKSLERLSRWNHEYDLGVPSVCSLQGMSRRNAHPKDCEVDSGVIFEKDMIWEQRRDEVLLLWTWFVDVWLWWTMWKVVNFVLIGGGVWAHQALPQVLSIPINVAITGYLATYNAQMGMAYLLGKGGQMAKPYLDAHLGRARARRRRRDGVE
jgi:hypothetical protein